MGIGLAAVKWPLFVTHREPWPLFEGTVTCILAAMSLLAFLGLRYPVRLLPILLFECAWKAIWLLVVAAPQLVAGTMNAATRDVMISCLVVVVVLAVAAEPAIPGRTVVADLRLYHLNLMRVGYAVILGNSRERGVEGRRWP